MSDPEGYLMVGIREMLRKAYSPKNLSKGSWRAMSDPEVMALLRAEVRELEEALDSGDPSAILREAVDVLAFASMLADGERGDPNVPPPRDLYREVVLHSVRAHRGMP